MKRQHPDKKARLNTTVDKETAERAKEMGYNLSGEFENYLKLLVYRPQGSFMSLAKEYDRFLRTIQKFVREYDIEVEVGEIRKTKNVELAPQSKDHYGDKYVLDEEGLNQVNKKGKYSLLEPYGPEKLLLDPRVELDMLYHPQKIINNLIDEIETTTKENKSKIQNLKIIRKALNSFLGALEDMSSESGIETPSFKRTSKDAETRQASGAHSNEGNKDTPT